jgi:hypothetical protein
MKPLTKTEKAVLSGGTVYQTKVKAVSDGLGKTERVIKRSKNAKLGKTVTAKAWQGMPIYTVTLEERATCPRSCVHWADCYGNNMPFATRYAAGADLESAIWSELEVLQKRHPEGFAVRLHVLGDFYSVGYVALWARALASFPALHVWGYTARHPGTDIGDAVDTLNRECSDRWLVRFSGLHGHALGALSMDEAETVSAVEKREAFICPEQTGKVDGCAACALCWKAQKPVAFITH